jgi:uncharacterized membrane protein YhhN
MKNVFLILFVLASTGVLASYLIDVHLLHQICKPLIMLSLTAYYATTVPKVNFSMSMVLALAFSFGGDTLLMFEKNHAIFFTLGLGSFLISHLFYIPAYRQHRWDTTANELQGVQRIRMAFPIILLGSGLIVVLYPVLNELKIPVLLYAVVLVAMVLNALFRYGRTSSKSFGFVFGGALLFMISDSLLAINKFLQPVTHAGLLIMITYCLAQYAIVHGILEHEVKAK